MTKRMEVMAVVENDKTPPKLISLKEHLDKAQPSHAGAPPPRLPLF